MILDKKKLKDLLDKSTLTRVKFAKTLGVSESCLYRWMKGQRQPTIDNYLRMMAAFGLNDLKDLLKEGEGENV